MIPPGLPDTILSYPLSIGDRFTTNLIFPYPVFNVDLGTGDVLAKKLGRTGNVVLLKANRAHFAATNVSVYLTNGALYSFGLSYADSPGVYNYFFRREGLPAASAPILFSGLAANAAVLEADAGEVAKARGFLHVHGSNGKVRLVLRGIYLKGGLLWLGFAARNKSLIGFEPDLIRFSLEDTKRARRMAVQSIGLDPTYTSGLEELPGGCRIRFGVGFSPFTIANGKKLAVEWSERGNGRRILVRIKSRELLRARKLD
jgi:conjugative transposon TraN protein